MARKPRKPKGDPPRDDPAAQAKAARAQQIKEYAMLLYSPEDAALAMEMSIEEFTAMLAQPMYRDAWANGRLAVKRSQYANILAAAKAGKVPAIRLALELIDRQPSEPENDANEQDDPLLKLAGGFDAEFQSQLRKHGGAA